MVYCIGLTGDIGSGKSTVAELFSKMGGDIIFADKISKEITQKTNPPTFKYEIILALKFCNRMRN